MSEQERSEKMAAPMTAGAPGPEAGRYMEGAGRRVKEWVCSVPEPQWSIGLAILTLALSLAAGIGTALLVSWIRG